MPESSEGDAVVLMNGHGRRLTRYRSSGGF
jgi:hypothetical protein